jgi:ankyrin repeat protein
MSLVALAKKSKVWMALILVAGMCCMLLSIRQICTTARRALLAAVLAGDADRVDEILKNNPALVHQKYTSFFGQHMFFDQSPLAISAIAGSPDVAVQLIRHGADVNERGDTVTPLLQAVRYGHMEVAGVLIESGANVHATGGRGDRTALSAAAAQGCTNLLALLMLHGANVNESDGFGETALMVAAMAGKVQALEFLLNRGADIEVRAHPDAHRKTALSYAVLHGHVDVVEILLDRGANATDEILVRDARNRLEDAPFAKTAMKDRYRSILKMLERARTQR